MAVVEIPGSKSITARALFLAAAAEGRTTLVSPLASDDTEAFVEGLRQLGYRVETGRTEWAIDGAPSGPPARYAEVFTRDGATTSRFLPTLAATGQGRYAFDASEQMRRRPMAPLAKALAELGAGLEFAGQADHHPVTVNAAGLAGGPIRLDAGTSSQFLTALLMAGPLVRGGLTIQVIDLVSVPYVGITTAMMRAFGVDVRENGRTFRIDPGRYEARRYQIEPDASSASYFFAMAALLGTSITVPGLGTDALQGDLRFVDVLARMGAVVEQTADATTVTGTGHLRGITVNMRDISDTMPTLAAIAPFADSPTRIVDVANTRVKECDRLEACAINLRSMGVMVQTGPRLDRDPAGDRAHDRDPHLPRPPNRDGVQRRRVAHPGRGHPRRPRLREEDLPDVPPGTRGRRRPHVLDEGGVCPMNDTPTGLLLGAAGMTLLAAAMSPTGGYPALLPAVTLLSLGQGIAWTAMFVAAGTGVDARHQGIASAMASTTQQIGGAVGLAVLIAVAGLGTTEATGTALVPGLRAAGWVAAALTLAGAGIALTLRRRRGEATVDERQLVTAA